MHNNITAEKTNISLTHYTDTLTMAKSSFFVWAAVLFPSSALARPLFTGRLISRADELLSEYDYVIIGGGASGLTVANRLSEQSGRLFNNGQNQSNSTDTL